MNTFSKQLIDLQPYLMFYGRRFTSNKQELEDLTQETIYRALKNKKSFKPNTNMKSWLYTIMRNTFINTYRKTKRGYTYENHLKADHITYTDKKTFENVDTSSDVETILSKFKPQQRNILQMRMDGYKYDEITEKISIPVGTVKSRIFHMKKRLLPYLQIA